MESKTRIPRTKQMVIQPNNLINASYTISKDEKHIVLMALGLLNPTIVNNSDTGIQFDMKHMYELSGETIQPCKYYARIRKAVKTLMERHLTIQIDEKTREHINWLSHYKEVKGSTELEIKLGSTMAKLLSELQDTFTTCLLSNAFKLNNIYSIRIYEMCMQWKTTGKTQKISVEQFRQILDLQNKYPNMKDLNKSVINVAIKDINQNTDIKVKPVYHKKSQTIQSLHFEFKFKSKEAKQEYIPKPSKSVQAIRRKNVNIKRQLTKAEKHAEFLRTGIQYN